MIYFITRNTGKFLEINQIIPELSHLELNLDEIQSLDPQKVIEHKLAQAASQHDGEFIVEDTSLELTCLQGLPGTFITWFETTLGVDGLAGVAMKYEDRSAIARVTIGYRNSEGQSHYFSGELQGDIVPPRGTNKFGWNPIFQPVGERRTFAEMTIEEKNHISMRGVAARQLAAHLSDHAK